MGMVIFMPSRFGHMPKARVGALEIAFAEFGTKNTNNEASCVLQLFGEDLRGNGCDTRFTIPPPAPMKNTYRFNKQVSPRCRFLAFLPSFERLNDIGREGVTDLQAVYSKLNGAAVVIWTTAVIPTRMFCSPAMVIRERMIGSRQKLWHNGLCNHPCCRYLEFHMPHPVPRD